MTDNAARYLGLAFSSAELLFELDGDGRVVFAIGATQKLVGLKQEELIGQHWGRLFAPDGRATVAALLESLDNADRRGPVRAELQAASGRRLKRYGAFSACRLPQLAPNISCSISLAMGASGAVEPKGPFGMHDLGGFVEAAEALMDSPPAFDLAVSFVEFQGLGSAAGALDPQAARAAMGRIAAAVRAESLSGETASQLSQGRFALVRSKAEAPDRLLNRLNQAAARAGVPIEASGSSVDLNPSPTGQGMRALKFALDAFIKDGAAAAGSTFSAVLAQTNAQARAFTQTVAEKKFKLVFQPIVDLRTGELHHFEVLSRLDDSGASPASAIRLAEELDIIHDLDMAVADQAMRKLAAQGNSRLKLAVNLSALSLERPGFIPALLSRAQQFQGLAGRLIFEITESAAIEDLDKANARIQALRARGFPVCLDDFGAGAAALSYLRALSVDTVKIDGQYVRDIATAGRADAVVRHISELCAELEVSTVAEMIETQEVADILRDLAIDYGQGYLFARPGPEPVYQSPPRPPPAGSGPSNPGAEDLPATLGW